MLRRERSGPPTQARIVNRHRGGAVDSVVDELMVEAPLELWVGGEPMVTIMRTPGHEADLITGLCWTEGWVQTPGEVLGVEEVADVPTPERGNVWEIRVAGELAEAPARRMWMTSSCGACGIAAIEGLAVRARPVRSAVRIDRALVPTLPDRMRAEQPGFERSGGLHAAGLFTGQGDLLVVREDIGRHNAVDSVIGWAVRGGIAGPANLGECVLVVSGRVSFEIAKKVVVAGIPIIVAVSAPSQLAIDVAERFQVTVCAFTRQGGFNVYSHSSRIR